MRVISHKPVSAQTHSEEIKNQGCMRIPLDSKTQVYLTLVGGNRTFIISDFLFKEKPEMIKHK